MFFRSEVGKWVITTGNHGAAARNLTNLTCLPLKCSDHLNQNPESQASQCFDSLPEINYRSSSEHTYPLKMFAEILAYCIKFLHLALFS